MIHFVQCKSRSTAARQYPGAARIVKVCGGYAAFDTLDDYRTWRNQK